MTKRRWLSVCLIALTLLCCGYAGCTEPRSEAQSLSAQDVCSEEEPGASLHYPKGVVASVSQLRSPFEEHPLTEGEQADGEVVKREPLDYEQQQAEAQALEVEQPTEEVEPESVTVSETESEFLAEHLLPEASLNVDQEAASMLGPSAPTPPSGPVCSDTQDSCLDAVLEQVEADVPDLREADVDAADCDLTSVPVVLENTANVHSGGTTTSHTDPALAPSGQGAPGLVQGVNTSHMLEEQGLSSHLSTETDPTPSAKDGEDIPTFDEWKRKVMEVEKEKTQAVHTSSNKGSHVVKKVQKNFNNYASVECGAKILGANPEAKSTSAILMENMDLYMLNPCSNKIWFIIELCEPIQIKQFDIANFELFSSTPKDFLVFISERYPTNKWLKLGTFHGRDERMVQSFPLDEHLYAKYIKTFTKYIKVELLSHFGSEHFCPFSLIRVFGTSMVEEYEEIADPSERADEQDDYFDHPPGYALPPEAKSSNNLIGSAKDVILNMVNNIAVNVLGGGPGSPGNFTVPALNTTKTSSQLESPTTISPAPALEPAEGDQPEAQEDPNDTLTEDPIPELPLSETPQLEYPADDQIVMPSPADDEEEEAYPPVVLLDREEDVEEEERERLEQESLDYGGDQITSPASPCCRSASLQEHLQQRCFAPLAPHSKRSSLREPAPELPPLHARTPASEEPSAPPAVSQPPLEPRERDVPADRVEGDVAGQPQPPQPKADQEEPGTDPFHLEPSQTCSTLPRPSSSDPSPAVELSRPTSIPQPQTPPEKSQEEEAEGEERPAPTPAVSSSTLTSTPTSSSSAPTELIGKPPPEERPLLEADLPEPPAPTQPPEAADPPSPPSPFPTVTSPMQQIPPPPDTDPLQESLSILEGADLVNDPAVSTETKMEELDDILFTSSPSGNGRSPPRSSSSSSSSSHAQSDFYAELQNATEHGNQVHGSGQKESVFMRLNNRIKALEMNMSLSGRYLEQLSQRYRKQMEEMQRAFNKTIIKLQNTSRLAEEQDQRQTESIQTMHSQLHNITQLVLNLTLRVGQLQNEVSDRQSYLLLCLVLGVLLGLLLCAQHCRSSALPPSTDPEPPIPKSYSYCCPERPFVSYDDPSLKRSASYPLLTSVDSSQLPTTEGPESLHAIEPEPHRLNGKKKRGRTKPKERVETLVSSTVVSAPTLANGVPLSNGAPRGGMDITTAPAAGLSLSHLALRDSPSERSSEGSSHSDEPSFCGLAASCSRICDGLPPAPRTRAAKRAFKRRRSKAADCVVADLVKAPRRGSNVASVVSVLQDRARENKELSSGTFGVKALSGPV